MRFVQENRRDRGRLSLCPVDFRGGELLIDDDLGEVPSVGATHGEHAVATILQGVAELIES
jgi:hypothetical protein